jgi:DUF1680 family protein
MERVLYNSAAGAKPIQEDGTTFYYSDYNNNAAKKVYYKDKWPCCSGTFPQLTADYGISSYYFDPEGVYVNLFLPSRVSWNQNGTQVGLTQRTNYPSSNEVELRVQAQAETRFAVHLRIPEWADANTRILVNGKSAGEIVPGKFFKLQRGWRDGDRVEYQVGTRTRLQAVDDQNPRIVALMRGPLALFATGTLPTVFSREKLLAATAVAHSSADCEVQAPSGKVLFRPFTALADEPYRLYQKVEA